MNPPYKIIAPLILKDKESPYGITCNGEILNTVTCKRIKQRTNNSGYNVVDLYQDHNKTTYLVHKLVAQTYIPNINNLPTVNHIDGDKSNNSVTNLEWASYSQNNQHAYDTGLHKPLFGESASSNKYKEETIRSICTELESGKQPLEVANLLNLPVSLVRSIKSKVSWVDISNQYHIPNTRFYMPEELRNRIKQLQENGMTIREICNEIGWNQDSIHYKRIKRAINR